MYLFLCFVVSELNLGLKVSQNNAAAACLHSFIATSVAIASLRHWSCMSFVAFFFFLNLIDFSFQKHVAY